MSLGSRIKLVRGKLSQKDFGTIFSATPNTIRGYETDTTSPNADFISAICEHYSLSSDWLLFGNGPMTKEVSVPPKSTTKPSHESEQHAAITVDANGQPKIPEWKNPDPEIFDYIPMAKANLSAGGEAFVLTEEIEGYYAFRNTWLNSVASSKRNLVLMRVIGDSMEPTIKSGDTVLIDTGRKEIKEGQIYALRVDNTVIIKRLAYRLGGKVMIISDNRQEFETYEASPEDVHVLGQVIFFSRVLIPE